MAQAQQSGLGALDRHGPGVVHMLHYEDLVARPEEAVRKLCAFAGVPFEPAMLEPHQSRAARRAASLSASWSNTRKPINTGSVGRYQRGLTGDERRQVEHVAGPVMLTLGYTPDGGRAVRPSPIEVRARDLALRGATELRSLRHDANHLRRWRRDATVRWLYLKARIRRLDPRYRGGRA